MPAEFVPEYAELNVRGLVWDVRVEPKTDNQESYRRVQLPAFGRSGLERIELRDYNMARSYHVGQRIDVSVTLSVTDYKGQKYYKLVVIGDSSKDAKVRV